MVTRNIRRLFKKANHQLDRDFNQFASQHEMTGMQMGIIHFLSQGSQASYYQRDIEKAFNMKASTTTVLLQRMEKKGLIHRQASAQDARHKLVQLTPKARKVEGLCQAYLDEEAKELAKHFSEQEIAIFAKILQYYINKE